LKIFFAVQSAMRFTWMLDKTAQSLLKSQAQLLQHQLLVLWTSATAVVVLHAMVAAVVVQTVVAQEVDLVTSVVVQIAVVQEVAQEMAHDQVEGLWLDPVDVQDAIAKVSFTNNPKGNLGVICLTLSFKRRNHQRDQCRWFLFEAVTSPTTK
jgi:hypothetical protein